MAQILDLTVEREVLRVGSLGTSWKAVEEQQVFTCWVLSWTEMRGDVEDEKGAWQRFRRERFFSKEPNAANIELASWDLLDGFVREMLEKEDGDE